MVREKSVKKVRPVLLAAVFFLAALTACRITLPLDDSPAGDPAPVPIQAEIALGPDQTCLHPVYFYAEGILDAEYAPEDIEVRWDFGDGSGWTGFTNYTQAEHRFAGPGWYLVRLELRNPAGQVTRIEKNCKINDLDLSIQKQPNMSYHFPVQYSVRVSSQSETNLSGLSYTWDPGEGGSYTNTSGTARLEYSYSRGDIYTVRLLAADADGSTAVAQLEVKLYDIAVPDVEFLPIPGTPYAVSRLPLTWFQYNCAINGTQYYYTHKDRRTIQEFEALTQNPANMDSILRTMNSRDSLTYVLASPELYRQAQSAGLLYQYCASRIDMNSYSYAATSYEVLTGGEPNQDFIIQSYQVMWWWEYDRITLHFMPSMTANSYARDIVWKRIDGINLKTGEVPVQQIHYLRALSGSSNPHRNQNGDSPRVGDGSYVAEGDYFEEGNGDWFVWRPSEGSVGSPAGHILRLYTILPY